MEKNNYLGTEKIGKLMKAFCLPCIASLIISCLYNIVDQIFVGNGVGYLGNAATGVVFPITVVGWALSLFFGDGAAAHLSVSLGRGKTDEIHKTVGNAILFSFLSGVAVIAISYIWGEGLLRILGATDATIDMAWDYAKIIYIMMPLALVQNTLAAIIRADGNPGYAMVSMIIGAAINIIGDPIAIFVLDMGIEGAAWATILGQFVSFLFCAVYLLKSKTFKISFSSFKIDNALLRQIMTLGTSSLLTQLSIVVITIMNNILLVQFGAKSEYGADIPLAAFVVIMKLFQIVLNIAIGIAAGAQPIVGYNYGAKNMDRVRELMKNIIKYTTIVCAVCTVLFEAIPGVFIRMFGSDGELYMAFATRCLRIYLVLIIFTCVQKVCSIFLQSIGHAKQAAPLSIIRDVLLIIFSLIVPNYLGVTGIFWAAPIADLIAMAITAVAMVKVWKELKMPVQAKAAKEMQSAAAHIQPSHPGPIITIARQHGSAGKRIGKLLAKELGIPCYYKEVTAMAAQESGLSKDFISDINQNSPERMHELYLSTNVVQQAVAAQDRIIHRIAENGSCVIVGRAADYVLRDHPDVVRIFVRAPKEYRIHKVMEMYGDSEAVAKQNVSHSDSARAAYYRGITGMEWNRADGYELCIDSSIGEEASAKVILSYLKAKNA